MTIDDASLCQLPLAETVFFPLSGNPPGFNHFAAAEWLLRAGQGWSRVVFVLSNGHHPDPHKPPAERDATSRLALLETMIGEVADPRRSLLARHAEGAGERLHIGPETLAVSDTEFNVPRAVRTVETVERILRDRPADAGPVIWFVGSDLVRRMADPAIFDDADLRTLAQRCHFAILERPGEPVAPALAMLQEYRGLLPAHTVLPTAGMPEFLANYLELSSTRIRHAAEAGDPTGGMVTRTAAATMEAEGWYREGRIVLRRVDLEGHEMGCRTRLQLDLEALQIELDATSARVAELLVERREHDLPHGLSVAETSAGGFLTAALAGRAGASRYFRQGRFAYDQVAKQALIPEGRDVGSSVSADMVSALAEGMAAQARTELALAESGMAGPPDPRRRSLKSGMSWIAMTTPEGTTAETLQLNPFLTRKEHQYGFATHALGMLERWLLAHRP
jgi:PncC family amidohydrolase